MADFELVGTVSYLVQDRPSPDHPWEDEASCATIEEAAAYMETYYSGTDQSLSQLVVEVPLLTGTVRLVAKLDIHLS